MGEYLRDTKTGDVYQKVHHGGNGCLFGLLAGIALIVVVVGGICTFGAGFANYLRAGIWNSNGYQVNAELTARANANIQETQFAKAGNISEKDFFTKLAKNAKISFYKVTNTGYQNGDFYFTPQIKNGDTIEHSVGIHYSFQFTYSNTGSQDTYIGTVIGDKLDAVVPARDTLTQQVLASNLTNEDVTTNDVHGINFGYVGSVGKISNFQAKIFLIDDLPTIDPRQFLPKIHVSLKTDNPALYKDPDELETSLQCQLGVTNTDTSSHTVSIAGTLDYTYTDMGDKKSINKPVSIADKVLVPPHTTYYDFRGGNNHPPTNNNPTSIGLYDPNNLNISPDRIQVVSFHNLSITLFDVGDDNPLVGDAATMAISQTCSYKK